MIRIEVFKNTDTSAKGREFVAILEVLELKDTGKRAVSTCMNFFQSTAEAARKSAVDFVASEQERAASVRLSAHRRKKA